MVPRVRSLLLATGKTVCAPRSSHAVVPETRSGCLTLVCGPSLAHARGKGTLLLAWLCVPGDAVWVCSRMRVCRGAPYHHLAYHQAPESDQEVLHRPRHSMAYAWSVLGGRMLLYGTRDRPREPMAT